MLQDPNNKPAIDCNDLHEKNFPDSNWKGRREDDEGEGIESEEDMREIDWEGNTEQDF